MLKSAAFFVVVFAAAPVLSGCKIVPIATEQTAEAKGFDARAYAEQLWASRALPHFEKNARALTEVRSAIAADLNKAGETYGYRPSTEGSPWSFIVSGTGSIKEKNTQSRAGTMVVTVDGADVTLQIGPVVKGNAVRDSLPFVTFKDFTNQIEYADAGKALTSLAIAPVTEAAAAMTPGQEVTFIGAMVLAKASDPHIVTPVVLQAKP